MEPVGPAGSSRGEARMVAGLKPERSRTNTSTAVGSPSVGKVWTVDWKTTWLPSALSRALLEKPGTALGPFALASSGARLNDGDWPVMGLIRPNDRHASTPPLNGLGTR